MPIRLGVTWSPLLESTPEALAAIDYVQLSIERFRQMDRQPTLPVILHGNQINWSLADPLAVDQRWIDDVNEAIEETATPWFSVHLGFAAEQVRFANHMLPVSDPLPRQVLVERFIEALNNIRTMLDVPLIVENLDYCPEGAYEHICQPAFVSEVILASHVGMLLDIGHLQVSADWLGFYAADALASLPIERTLEIHVSSPRPLDDGSGRLDDTHEPLLDRDYALLRELLSRTQPRALTLEYRRDRTLLIEQIAALRSILTDADGAFFSEAY